MNILVNGRRSCMMRKLAWTSYGVVVGTIRSAKAWNIQNVCTIVLGEHYAQYIYYDDDNDNDNPVAIVDAKQK